MLSLVNIRKDYGKFTYVYLLNLELEEGLYAMLAPNGAGKTTIIRMMTTLLFPTSGEILYDGENILEMGESYRKMVGYLPQQFGYYKSNTPVQYLSYLAALKKIPRQEAKRQIPELLELVGLSGEANKKMKKFSGGMTQRVGIAQALLGDPKILILDEPTAGLDPKETGALSQSPLLHVPQPHCGALHPHCLRCGVGGEPGYAAEGSQAPSDGHGSEYLQPLSGQNLREKDPGMGV